MGVKEKRTLPVWYRWVIVGVCFLLVFVCLGFCSSNKGLYLAAITEALGIPRSLFSVGDSIRYIVSCVVNLFFGALVRKFGTKKLIIGGILSLMVSMLCYSLAESVWGFYVGGAFLGLGLSWCTTVMAGYVIGLWCKENKGTVMGAVLAANGVGATVGAQIVSPMIYEAGNPFGYRNAYRLIILLLAVVLGIVLLFYREASDAPTEEPGKKKKSRSADWAGLEWNTILHRPWFYCGAVCVFLTGMVLQSVTGVAAAHMKDCGIDADFVALTVSAHSLALAACKFLAGLSFDKKGLRFTMTGCCLAGVAAMLLLASVSDTVGGRVTAMLYAVISSVALPLETVMLPLLAGDLAGERAYVKVMGIFAAVNVAGYAVGTPLVNLVFDSVGSYVPILYVLCAVMVLVTGTIQYVISKAHGERKEIVI